MHLAGQKFVKFRITAPAKCGFRTSLLEKLSKRSVTAFLCGGTLGFDTIAASSLATTQENARNQTDNRSAVPRPGGEMA